MEAVESTTGEEEKAAGLGVQVIARAASVLRALEGRPDGLSLGQIAKEVGLARSTVQRIVAALLTEDFVTEAQPGRGVRIGAGLARIAASLSSNFTEILAPASRRVARRSRRDRRSLDLVGRLGRLYRPDSRATAPCRPFGHRRTLSAALHCERQGHSRLFRERRLGKTHRKKSYRTPRSSARGPTETPTGTGRRAAQTFGSGPRRAWRRHQRRRRRRG